MRVWVGTLWVLDTASAEESVSGAVRVALRTRDAESDDVKDSGIGSTARCIADTESVEDMVSANVWTGRMWFRDTASDDDSDSESVCGGMMWVLLTASVSESASGRIWLTRCTAEAASFEESDSVSTCGGMMCVVKTASVNDSVSGSTFGGMTCAVVIPSDDDSDSVRDFVVDAPALGTAIATHDHLAPLVVQPYPIELVGGFW